MHSAEVAIAKAQAAADGKREAEKEVAELKKYKDFRERNEEEHNLVMLAAKACMFNTDKKSPDYKKLLPAAKQDRANFARCMTVAAQLTAQIKPLTNSDQPNQSQTMNINLSGYTDEELKKLEPHLAAIENILDKQGTAKGAGEKASN